VAFGERDAKVDEDAGGVGEVGGDEDRHGVSRADVIRKLHATCQRHVAVR
jgi:hypothetical protein